MIRKLARDDETKPTHLRVVAVAALGDLGDEGDVALLERLSTAGSKRVTAAAKHALQKVRRRVSAGGTGP